MAILLILLPSVNVFTGRSLECPVVLVSISLQLQKLYVKAQSKNVVSHLSSLRIGLCF